MRNFRNLIIGFVAVALIGGIVLAQTSQYGSRGVIFNGSTVTINKNKVLKWDTTYTALTSLDTTEYVHQRTDTSASSSGAGNCSTYVGSTQLKGHIRDTLDTKTGGNFDLKLVPITTPSTDSVFIYGYAASGYGSRSDSVIKVDTVILAAGGKISKYRWRILDSLRIRTANAGTDCVRIYYHQPLRAVVADTIATNIAGVMPDSSFTEKIDTVKTLAYGTVISSGDVRVYASGKNDVIYPGDELMVGNNGKVVKSIEPKSDTVRYAGTAPNKRYVKGVRDKDPIIVARNGRTTSTTTDTMDYRANAAFLGDTIYFVQSNLKGIAIPTSAAEDSLTYLWIPRGIKNLGSNYIIGTALQYCDTDSTLIYIRLLPR